MTGRGNQRWWRPHNNIELCIVGIAAAVASLLIGVTIEAFIQCKVDHHVGTLRVRNGVEDFSEDPREQCHPPRLTVFVTRLGYRIGLANLRSLSAREATESASDTSGEWFGTVVAANLRHELVRVWERIHYDGEVIVAASDEASLQEVLVAVDAALHVMQREGEHKKWPLDSPRHKIILAPAN
jgi:hypothetical protein